MSLCAGAWFSPAILLGPVASILAAPFCLVGAESGILGDKVRDVKTLEPSVVSGKLRSRKLQAAILLSLIVPLLVYDAGNLVPWHETLLVSFGIVVFTQLMLLNSRTAFLGDILNDRLCNCIENWIVRPLRSSVEVFIWFAFVGLAGFFFPTVRAGMINIPTVGGAHLFVSAVSILFGDAFRSSVQQSELDEVRSFSETLKKRIPAPKWKETWSSKVKFNSAQGKYWRISNEYYDLTEFADSGNHPGGRDLLYLARDRFGDCTYAFEAHHPNQPLVKKMLEKYKVKDISAPPQPEEKTEKLPSFAADDSFYSVLRSRVNTYLKANGGSGPTTQCLQLWWIVVASWISLYGLMVYSGSFVVTVLHSLVSAILGGFGHSWVHQPRRYRLYAYCLDFIGFSSENWIREHLLQHHMYTNSPLDNHFKGTDPFLVVDPTVERSFLQKYILPFANPVVLFFGVWGNYLNHTFELMSGRETFSWAKLIMPAQLTILLYRFGYSHGLSLFVIDLGVMSVWYFTVALLNHNTEQCHDICRRNKALDWGHSQLMASSDMEPGLSFLGSFKYLWLNYHTVHHLFPHTDMSKHPGIQKVLIETVKEFPEVEYKIGKFRELYWEMITSFRTPRALGEEINLFPGNGYLQTLEQSAKKTQ